MRTVCGWVRWAGRLGRCNAAHGPTVPVAGVRPLITGRPLLTGEPGEQRRAGWRLDQVDHTTCASAVLIALAAWADPEELGRLEIREVSGGRVRGFGDRYDARQHQVHRETNRFWPRALGTTPWAMVAWLRRHVPAAGRYRVRLVDDTCAADVTGVESEIAAALEAGRPVPLLVGAALPRHYVLALAPHPGGGWRVYEPGGGVVRVLDPALVAARRLGPVLGWDRLHAVLRPV
jgi:hypothetical protein